MAVRAGALENLVMFNGAYRGSRVLVTGHTGFKGSWLCHWLQRLGAQVTGVALEPDGALNLFSLLGLRERIDHRVADVRDAHAIQRIVAETRPAYVFHLAAQALVRLSYQEPKATFDVNVGGTVNLLEAVRSCPDVRSCVVVTSDKCYDNREQALPKPGGQAERVGGGELASFLPGGRCGQALERPRRQCHRRRRLGRQPAGAGPRHRRRLRPSAGSA